jgi:hypothetical protein
MPATAQHREHRAPPYALFIITMACLPTFIQSSSILWSTRVPDERADGL